MDSFFGFEWPSWETTAAPGLSSAFNHSLTTLDPVGTILLSTASIVLFGEKHADVGPILMPIDIFSEREEVEDEFPFTTFEPYDHNDTYGNLTGSNLTGSNFTEMVKPDWYVAMEHTIKWAMLLTIVGTMFGMGAAIYWKDIVDNLWPPIGVIIGMCGQFIILPATAFGFSLLFQLNPFEAMGALIVSCCPGGSFSNFFTFWVEGELALSIIMTTFSSMLALGGMPFNLWLYSGFFLGEEKGLIEIPYLKIIIGLLTVIVPVILGMIVRHFSKKYGDKTTNIMSKLGYVGFTLSLVCYGILYWPLFLQCSPLLFASGVILPLTGFSLAYIAALICKRSHKICRTIGIETGSQNMPIALNIIFFSFPPSPQRAEMALFPTIYGIFMLVEVFVGIILYRGVVHYKNKRLPPPIDETKDSALHASAPLHEMGTYDEKMKMNP